jgi:purine-nucleoside phosphorylase
VPAKNINIDLKDGIYAGVLGPTYETPAEIRMYKTLGGDLVGMSTVPEAIAAHHAGLKVGGIACVTNMAAGISKEKLDHADVKDVAAKAMQKFF